VKVKVEQEIGGRTFSLTTGEWAKQASGAVIVQYDETVLFVAAQSGPARPGIDFFPLQVDYRERELMLERQREGIAKAKAEGKYKGRAPTARRKAADVIRLKAEGKTGDQIAADLGIGRASVFRVLREARA
jgi:hypothetical protein